MKDKEESYPFPHNRVALRKCYAQEVIPIPQWIRSWLKRESKKIREERGFTLVRGIKHIYVTPYSFSDTHIEFNYITSLAKDDDAFDHTYYLEFYKGAILCRLSEEIYDKLNEKKPEGVECGYDIKATDRLTQLKIMLVDKNSADDSHGKYYEDKPTNVFESLKYTGCYPHGPLFPE